MAIGDINKDGVIIKCDEGSNYYNGMSDTSLTPIVRARDGATVKTQKTYGVVHVANNVITVSVYPDGKVIIQRNDEGGVEQPKLTVVK